MTLAEALEQVDLEPGKTYRCQVRGVTVELKVCPELKYQPSLPLNSAAERVELRDCDHKPDDDWVELPGPKPVWTIKLKKGPPMTAMVIDHTVDQMVPE